MGNSKKKKLPKVDLLYVYSNSQIDQIKQYKGFNMEILPESEKPMDNPYDFTDDEDDEEEVKHNKPKNEKITQKTNHTTHKTNKVDTFDDLDFDDI